MFSSSTKMRTLTRQMRSGRSESVISTSTRCSDIVKSGYLHIKRPPSQHSIKIRLKAWQRRYFVLRDDSFETAGTTVLEMYDTQTAWMQAEKEGVSYSDLVQYTVDLRTVSHVEEYEESKCYPFSFVVTRSGQSPLVMGAESDLEMKEWLVAIKLLADKMKHLSGNSRQDSLRRPSCPAFLKFSSQMPASTARMSVPEVASRPDSLVSSTNSGSPFASPRPDSVLSSNPSTPLASPSRARVSQLGPGISDNAYPVKVVATEAAIRNGISGNHYALCLQTGEVILKHLASSQEVMKWPVNNLKKFKSESLGSGVDHVTLEASKHCGSGEGTYILATMCGAEIVELVRKASRQMSRKLDASSRFMEQQMNRLKRDLLAPNPGPMLDRVPSAPCLAIRDPTPQYHAPPPPPTPASPNSERHSKRVTVESTCSSSSSGEIFTSTTVVESDVQFCGVTGAGYLELLEDDPLSFTIQTPFTEEEEENPPVTPPRVQSSDKRSESDDVVIPPPVPPRVRHVKQVTLDE